MHQKYHENVSVQPEECEKMSPIIPEAQVKKSSTLSGSLEEPAAVAAEEEEEQDYEEENYEESLLGEREREAPIKINVRRFSSRHSSISVQRPAEQAPFHSPGLLYPSTSRHPTFMYLGLMVLSIPVHSSGDFVTPVRRKLSGSTVLVNLSE
ncbi:hypothetical protein KQX54_012100 [Cotesia glomerata]|uniref:Uncharacterized protein n=1 Tax=Cotesia glomerata TaxID=32391 RepID=A0AAV7J3K4_COTGL|nr:hypothetical protein KQX54_012100 [Cotesia glomerata]